MFRRNLKWLLAAAILAWAPQLGYAQQAKGAQEHVSESPLLSLMKPYMLYQAQGLKKEARAYVLGLQTEDGDLGRLVSLAKVIEQGRQGKQEDAIPGTVTSFYVSFPFECPSMYDFGQPMEPEKDGFDTSKALSGAKYPSLNWMKYESKGNHGLVIPHQAMDLQGYVAVYLTTRIVFEGNKPMEGILEIPSNAPVLAWLNQTRVVQELEKGAMPPPSYGTRYHVTVRPGENILTIKIASQENNPFLKVFLSDHEGKPLPFKVDLTNPIISGGLGQKLESTWEPSAYERILSNESVSPAYRAYYARMVYDEEKAVRVIHDLLLTDTDRISTLDVDEIYVAVYAIEDPAKSLVIVKKALERHPGDRKLEMLEARLTQQAGEQGDGVRLADEWPEIDRVISSSPDTPDVSSEMIRKRMIASMELSHQQALNGMKILNTENCIECDESMMGMGSLTDKGKVREYREIVEKVYKANQDQSSYLVDYLDMKLRHAVAANDERLMAITLGEIEAEVGEFLGRHPYDDYLWNFWLDIVAAYGMDNPGISKETKKLYKAAGFDADAETQYETYLYARVNSSERWMKHAEYSISRNHLDEAISSYEMASNLQPEDETILERVAMLRKMTSSPKVNEVKQTKGDTDDSSFEKPYIVSEVPGNRDKTANGIVSLLDNRVVRILPNGLSSTFNQIVFEVLDDQGLKALRSMPINYSPTDEKIDIMSVTITKKDGTTRRLYHTSEYNMADESIKMYYDMRQIVIEVPDLSVGDRIEYRFKRTMTQRSASSVYFFSDIYQLQTWYNRQWSKYTLIAPASMKAYFMRHDPSGGHAANVTVSESNDYIVSSFEEKDMPRLLSENNMPGATEVMPFLYISTFETWQQFANWYTDLATTQWKIDEAIRQEVHRLTEGISDPFEKLKRIHSFVVKSTRYVALEFGIHGHKPYPVSQVFERRFGDCKDKASLLKVMLDEAGIPTNFVLARTQHNGNVSSEQPNPYLFDHAIVYVPQFDLFLDGTAEFSGTRELPEMDQDILVFIVKNNGSYELRRTPLSKAEDNLSKNVRVFDLSKGSPVQYTIEDTYTGMMAPAYRSRYQVESLQRERLESELAKSILGTKVESVVFSDLSDLEKDVTVSAHATTSLNDVVKLENGTWLVYPLVSTSRIAQMFAPTATRKLPLMQILPLSYDRTVTLILPAGADVVLPDDISETTSFGHYEVSTKLHDNHLNTSVKLSLTQTRIKPEDYGAYLDFLQRFDRRLNTQLKISGIPADMNR